MICMCNINSGQKRFDGVPAKSAADSVSQGGFPLKHQNLKGATPAKFSSGCRALTVTVTVTVTLTPRR